MARKRLGKVQSVFKLTAGSLLDQSMTASSPADGESLSVEQVTDFDPDGGTAVIGNETISYRSIDESSDELTGVVRGFDGTTAASHSIGDFIQESTEPTVEKWARVKLDDEEEVREIPVPAYLYPMLRVGSYTDETAPSIPVYYDEDEDGVIVMDGPIGAVPTFDEDLEVLPEAGIREWAGEEAFTEIQQTVQPIGLGDGATPTDPASAPVITQGPNMHVVDMRAYTRPTDWLANVVEYSTNSGIDWTSLGDSGSDVFAHTNLTIGTAYRYRFSVRDSEGNLSAVSPASIDYTARGSLTGDIEPLAITQTKIADDSIDTPQLRANAVGTNELQALSVTAGILASTITISNTFQTAAFGSRVMFDGSGIRLINSSGVTVADLNASTGIATLVGSVYKSATSGSRVELDSSGLRFYDSSSALKVELSTATSSATFVGDITSGSTITGVTITGGTVRTASSGTRIELDSLNHDMTLYGSSGTVVGSIRPLDGGLVVQRNDNIRVDFLSTGVQIQGGLGSTLTVTSSTVAVVGPMEATGRLKGSRAVLGDTSAIPEAGFLSLYKGSGNTFKVRFSDGTIKDVTLT